MGGAAEIAAGKIATVNGSTDAVRAYGSHLVDDHTKAGDELKQIAATKSLQAPDAPDAKHQKAAAKLQETTGKSFDPMFKSQMVADHKATIALFKKEASGGKDADLKAFAVKTLPTLQQHLKMAQYL